MKAIALICLLFVAGSYALPAESEVVAPANNRMLDLIVLDCITQFRDWVIDIGWDPKILLEHYFDIIIIDGLVEIKGGVRGFRFTGLSNIGINNLYYNILWTRLDVDLVMPEICIFVEEYFVHIIYGDLDVSFKLSGTFCIENIRLVGDALIPIYPRPVINNINPNFSVGKIESKLTVVGTEDHSDTINNFFNETVPGFLWTFRSEINTIIGEVIREFVNWRWWW